MDFYSVIITDTFMRFCFGKRNGVTSSQATEDRSTRWKKTSQPPKLSEITRPCIFECAMSSFFQYVPTREKRRKNEMGSQRQEHATCKTHLHFCFVWCHMDSRINMLCPISIPAFSFPRCLKLCDANF